MTVIFLVTLICLIAIAFHKFIWKHRKTGIVNFPIFTQKTSSFSDHVRLELAREILKATASLFTKEYPSNIYSKSKVSKSNHINSKIITNVTLQNADKGDESILYSVYNALAARTLAIPAKGDLINTLSNPAEFYQTLLSLIRNSEHEIVFSALYIGDGPYSTSLVDTIVKRILRACEKGEHFKFTLLLDLNRMQEKNNLLTLQPLLELNSLLKENIEVNLYLFHAPNYFNKFFNRLPRIKELIGVQHMKCFCFDNTVLLTGANLSDNYFIERMDRYVVIQGNSILYKWCVQFTLAVCQISHRILSLDILKQLTSSQLNSLKVDSQLITENIAHDGMARKERGMIFHKKSNSLFLPNGAGYDPVWQQKEYSLAALSYLRKILTILQEEVNQEVFNLLKIIKEDNSMTEEEDIVTSKWDTIIFPSIQFGHLGIYHNQETWHCLLELLHHCPSLHVTFTSPYLNFNSEFLNILKKSSYTLNIITSSLESNSWHTYKGIKSKIPLLYKEVTRRFMKKLSSSHLKSTNIYEYSKNGETFHAKGALISLSKELIETTHPSTTSIQATTAEHLSPDKFIIFTYGSTNYSVRSMNRDFEWEFFFLTKNIELQKKLKREIGNLVANSELAYKESLIQKFSSFWSICAFLFLSILIEFL